MNNTEPTQNLAWGSVASINAAEWLRAFAVAHNETAFAHLVTAALVNDEAFAVERLEPVLSKINAIYLTLAHQGSALEREHVLEIIRATDTSRPDGAITRTLVNP